MMKKSKYNHSMIREIHDQPWVIKNLAGKYIRESKIVLPQFREFQERFSATERFIFWGIGSSYHAALYANYLFEDITGLPCECEPADEAISRRPVIEPSTTIVVISQSGETTDVIEAIKLAKMSKAFIIAVTNNPDSTIGSLAEVSLPTEAGEEKAVAATKTLTSQLFILALLALYTDQLKHPDRTENLLAPELKTLHQKLAMVLMFESKIAKIAAKSIQGEHLYLLGRKYHYPIALEGALKFKETSYLHAEGFAAEELRHGPIAAIEKRMPVICLMPQDSVYQNNLVVLRDLLAIGAVPIVVTTQGNEELRTSLGQVITVPPAMETVTPILSVVVLQLLAYHLAVERNLPVDQPRYIHKYLKK